MDEVLFPALGAEWTLGILLIPVIGGLIGYCTNWVAIKMMFYPVKFVGWRIPYTLFGIPLIGWQGMVPNRVAKLASIMVDSALDQIGAMAEILEHMEPEVIAAYMVEHERDRVRQMTAEILAEQHPTLWAAMPARAREALHARIEAELPGVMADAFEKVGHNVDALLDVKLMVVRFLEADPGVLNKLVWTLAAKEMRFVIRSGLYFGVPLGVGPMLVYAYLTQHWAAVPIGAAIVGYLTNWIALKLIFYPAEPRRFGPFRMHGLMLRRKEELGMAYAQVFAHDLLTAPKIVNTMLHGPAADRTRQFLMDSIEAVIEDNVGPARTFVRATVGQQLQRLEARAADATLAMVPNLLEEHDEFIRDRQERVAQLVGERLGGMAYTDFQQLMRAPFEQDEWLAISVGAVIGFGAGLLQVAVTLGGAG